MNQIITISSKFRSILFNTIYIFELQKNIFIPHTNRTKVYIHRVTLKENSRKIYTDRLYYFFRLRISLWTREINSQIVTIFPRPWKYFIIMKKNKRKVSHLAQNRIIIILYYIVFSLISTVPRLQLQLRIIHIQKICVFSRPFRLTTSSLLQVAASSRSSGLNRG